MRADVTPTANPLLARKQRMPGNTIRIPSMGKFYTNGELTEDTVNGEIELFPMTLNDEILMKSPDMLIQGTAIDRVLRRCSPNILEPLDLLLSDIDFILTSLRRISFGKTIDLRYMCNNVTDVEEGTVCNHKIDVTIDLDAFTSKTKPLEDATVNNLIISMESDGLEVHLRPVTMRDFIRLQQMDEQELRRNPDALERFTSESYASVIRKVGPVENNTDENREFIIEWLNQLPRGDSTLITQAIENIPEWGISFEHKIKCPKCKKIHDIAPELNPTAFFMLPSSQETRK